jgi:hypothetical protein
VALRQSVERGLARRLFGASPQGSLALLRGVWVEAVGPEVAQRTEVLALEGRTLRVRVPDARWRKVLHRMQRDILSRMWSLAGDMAPGRLGFQEGPVSQPRAPAAPADPQPVIAPAPLPESVAAEAAAIADDEIRARFEECAARYLGRQHPPKGAGPIPRGVDD